MSETNNEIKIGSIPTINGILDKQGYIVYSISSVCVTSNTGGLGKGGLFLIIKKNEQSE